MELSWTTFVLEIINFLVLVWILKRFFYAPVQAVIARRRAAIDKQLADARAIREEAEGIEQQYKGRLQDWEREREAAHEELRGEIEAERGRLKQALDEELQRQREREKVLESRRLDEAMRQAQEQAMADAGDFLRRLLEELAGPEMQGRILDLVQRELGALPADQRRALAEAWAGNREPIVVDSAYAIDTDRQQALAEAFRQVLGPSAVSWTFRVNRELVAGLHISIGAWTLAANLRDEMRFFTASGRG